MKVEETNEGLNLFLNNIFFSSIDWNDKTSIENCIKDIFLKLKKIFNIKLKGFYKVKIYPNEFGTLIESIKIDDDNYDGSELEFRIIVIFNKDLYLKVENYFDVENHSVYFCDNHYYINLEEVDNFLKYSDLGVIVLDDDIDFKRAIYLNKKDYF